MVTNEKQRKPELTNEKPRKAPDQLLDVSSNPIKIGLIIEHTRRIRLSANINPMSIWCQNDVVPTSMRRNHIASTLIRRHFPSFVRWERIMIIEHNQKFAYRPRLIHAFYYNKKNQIHMVYQNQWMSRASGSGSWNKCKSQQSGIVVPNRATFEYSYSVSSIRTNRATVFV